MFFYFERVETCENPENNTPKRLTPCSAEGPGGPHKNQVINTRGLRSSCFFAKLLVQQSKNT